MDESHPIPQDITGFQFKLIGTMTIKQFAYVAGGIIFGWIFFLLPIFIIIKLPIAILLGLCGLILAFVPIHGRPADTMVFLFIKALFHPTQYQYQPGQVASTTTTAPLPPTKKEEKKEEKQQVYFASKPQLPTTETTVELPPAPEEPIAPIAPAQEEKKEEKAVEANVEHITTEITQAKEEEAQAQSGTPAFEEAHQKVISLEQDLQSALAQKQQLEEELVQLRQQLATKSTQPVYTPTEAVAPQEQTTHVKKIPQDMKTAVGAPFVPDVPNLITGVVKDPRGNVLPNILIEVKDKDNNPVRAFKTNPLGQFASATPLVDGTYTISFEDPKKQHEFDAVEIVADGNLLAPFEVTSVDEREQLRQSLFG